MNLINFAYIMPKILLNVLFYFQFRCCIFELFENYLFGAFMRSFHLTRSVRLYLPSLKCKIHEEISIPLQISPRAPF